MQKKSTEYLPQAAVCAWQTGPDFLVYSLHPHLHTIPLNPSRIGLPRLKRDIGTARIFLFHVNITRQDLLPLDRPAMARWLSRHGVVALNGRLEDMGKRNLQKICAAIGLPSCRASRRGNNSETLLVKPDANCGGIGERALPARLRKRLGVHGPAKSGKRIELFQRGEIPEAMWRDKSLTVERYIDNGKHIFHRAYLLGRRLVAVQSRSPHALKEMSQHSATAFRYVHDHFACPSDDTDPASVASRLSRALHLDFGAVDLMQDSDGTIYPVDVNPTPYWAEDRNSDLVLFLRQSWATLQSGAEAASS